MNACLPVSLKLRPKTIEVLCVDVTDGLKADRG